MGTSRSSGGFPVVGEAGARREPPRGRGKQVGQGQQREHGGQANHDGARARQFDGGAGQQHGQRRGDQRQRVEALRTLPRIAAGVPRSSAVLISGLSGPTPSPASAPDRASARRRPAAPAARRPGFPAPGWPAGSAEAPGAAHDGRRPARTRCAAAGQGQEPAQVGGVPAAVAQEDRHDHGVQGAEQADHGHARQHQRARLGPQETHADQRALPRHRPRAARRLPGR